MRTFEINGKKYIAKAFDFNTVCDLEDMGVNMSSIGNKPMSAVRAYFALCASEDIEFAGKEIESHIIGGGDLNDIRIALSEEMEKSDFFQALIKKAKKETAEA